MDFKVIDAFYSDSYGNKTKEHTQNESNISSVQKNLLNPYFVIVRGK